MNARHFSFASFILCAFALGFCLSACELRFGATPLPPPPPTQPPSPILTVVWAAGGDLFAWREDDPAPRQIASGAVITPYLAPDGRHVAFTRGAQGDAISLWAVASDGTGEQQLVAPDVIPSIRSGHPQIDQVNWLDTQTVYFNTLQQHETGSVNADDLYRIELGGVPQLILPPGAGGDFALTPDGQHIAVVRAGEYDMQKGQVTLLDPLGVNIDEKLSFTALSAPSEVPFYPPLAWNGESTFLRVPVPDRESDRVTLWRVPVEGAARIFGYVDVLPAWSPESGRMLSLAAGSQLMIADENGENAQMYASSAVSPRWISGNRFVYRANGALWLGQRGQAPRLLLDMPVEQVIFAGADRFVYWTAGELRAAPLDSVGSTLIAAVAPAPAFAAVVAP